MAIDSGMKDKHHTLETRKKISDARKKIIVSGKWVHPYTGKHNPFLIGKNNGMFGKHHSNKTCELMSKIKKAKFMSGELVPWNKGKVCPKISESNSGSKNHMFGKHHSDATKKKMFLSHHGKHIGEKNSFYGKHHTPEQKIHHSIVLKEFYKSHVHPCIGKRLGDEQLKKILHSCRVKPNKFECDVKKWLDKKEPNQWTYVGDGKVIINGHCPDFINCNGKKEVILANGLYWHTERINMTCEEAEIKERKPYEDVGFSVKFIWSDDFYGYSS